VNPVVLFLIVAGVVVVAMMLRSSGGKSGDGGEAEEGDAVSVLDADDDAGHDEAGGSVPITAEGIVMMPDGHELRLLPLFDSEEAAPDWLKPSLDSSALPYSVLNRIVMRNARGSHGAKPGTALNVGDFTAARIRPGVAGSFAWRLETLGRDGDFGFFPFATKSGAQAAMDLLDRHKIVTRELDDEGNPIPASAEDFEEARRRYEETESSLALDIDEDEERGSDYSDRR
jgi:hypothetical protein